MTGEDTGLGVALVAVWSAMQAEQRTSEWVNVLLGVLLFVAPWVLGFTGIAAAAWNAWIVGLAIAVIAALTQVPHLPRTQLQH